MQYIRSTHPTKKLSEKFLGPFKIITQPGSHSFTLSLPDSMQSIHPVFHVSQLEPATPNSISRHLQTPPPPIEVNSELESLKSSTLRLTRGIGPADSCTWSAGPVMKAPTRRCPGSLPLNLGTPRSLYRTSTWPTPTSLDLSLSFLNFILIYLLITLDILVLTDSIRSTLQTHFGLGLGLC